MAKLFVNIGKLFGKPFVNSKQFAKLFDFFFACAAQHALRIRKSAPRPEVHPFRRASEKPLVEPFVDHQKSRQVLRLVRRNLQQRPHRLLEDLVDLGLRPFDLRHPRSFADRWRRRSKLGRLLGRLLGRRLGAAQASPPLLRAAPVLLRHPSKRAPFIISDFRFQVSRFTSPGRHGPADGQELISLMNKIKNAVNSAFSDFNINLK